MVGMATKQAATRSFATSVDIPAADRAKVVKILNQHLADAADLWSQAKQAHWNVKGPDFWQLHKLFDEVAGEAAGWADDCRRARHRAGRLRHRHRSDGGRRQHPAGVPHRHHRQHGLRPRPWPRDWPPSPTRPARRSTPTDKLGDANTADLFTEISRCADKYLYFLEAHLQD